MMEWLKRLGKPVKALHWYHKVLVIPALALTMFTASLVAPGEAQAHAGQWFDQYGTFGWGSCYYDHYDYTDTYYNYEALAGGDPYGGVNESRACAYWQRNDPVHGRQFMYIPTRNPYNWSQFNNEGYWYVIWDDGSWNGPWTILDHFCWNYGC